MTRVLAALVLASAFFGMCLTPAGAPETPLSLVNTYRAAHGLPALQPAADLTRAAQTWVDQMAASGTLSHAPSIAVAGWATVAENVGRGPSIESIQTAFEASPAHEHNLVGPYTHLGVAVATSSDIVWVVQRFAAHATPAPTAATAPATTTTTTVRATTTTQRETTCR